MRERRENERASERVKEWDERIVKKGLKENTKSPIKDAFGILTQPNKSIL
jgi:hypothetical protein